MEYNVRDYGAAGDGASEDRNTIQEAIDACSEAGESRVVPPGGGTYMSGSLALRPDVELYVESGAVLKADTNPSDYQPLDPQDPEGSVEHEESPPSYINCEYDGEPRYYFIYGRGGENIRITGFGTTDRSEEIYYGKQIRYHIEGVYYPRIPMILMEDVEHLTMRDVTLTRCTFWTLHMADCRDVLVDSVRILNNLRMANCDGIDPDHCQDVRIVNCHVECADNCIVLKNTKGFEKYGLCKNILISGCTLISTSSAVKIGTGSEDDFENIIIENCCISRISRGVSLHLRDKGNIRNVLVSNVTIETRRFSEQWWGQAEPVYVTVMDRKEGVTAGQISNVRLRDINCRGENGIFICTSPGHVIGGLKLENVHVTLEEQSKWPCDDYDIRPCRENGILHSGLYGLYTEMVGGLVLFGLQIECCKSMEPYVAGERNLRGVNGLKEDQQIIKQIQEGRNMAGGGFLP